MLFESIKKLPSARREIIAYMIKPSVIVVGIAICPFRSDTGREFYF